MKQVFFLARFASLAGLGFYLLCGCSPKMVKEKEQAIAIAKQEATQRGWKDFEVEDVHVENKHWIVTIWSLPKTPGGHMTIEISSEGKVLRFEPGL